MRDESRPLTSALEEGAADEDDAGRLEPATAAEARQLPLAAGGEARRRRTCRYVVAAAVAVGLLYVSVHSGGPGRGAAWAAQLLLPGLRTSEADVAFAGPGEQCGGNNYTGITACRPGYQCTSTGPDRSICKANALGSIAQPYDYCRWVQDGVMTMQLCPEGMTCSEATNERSVCLPDRLKHPMENCWEACGKTAGDCLWCGAGNACCKMGDEGDPPECHGVHHFLTTHHECVVPEKAVPVKHQGQDCYKQCTMPGSCRWCGPGNACCRKGLKTDPAECKGVTDFSAWDHHVCVAPVVQVTVQHAKEDCWPVCGHGGYCDWCGIGNACCRKGYKSPPECTGDIDFPVDDHHTCVAPVKLGCRPGEVATGTSCVKPAAPIPMTFYIYMVTNDTAPDVSGSMDFDAASLSGVLWYLHNEVVTRCPRKNHATHIRRYKVVMQNTQALYEPAPHYQFGPFAEFKDGKCMTADCGFYWDQFGYVVGCQPLNAALANYGVQRPSMYSLPGQGECDSPDGSRHCTWHFEGAGAVLLDELVGIEDYTAFCDAQNVEYDPMTDRGRGIAFWDRKTDAGHCKWRLDQLQRLFEEKHPEQPVWLGEPFCDRPLGSHSESPVGQTL